MHNMCLISIESILSEGIAELEGRDLDLDIDINEYRHTDTNTHINNKNYYMCFKGIKSRSLIFNLCSYQWVYPHLHKHKVLLNFRLFQS